MSRRLGSLALLLAWLSPAAATAAIAGHELVEHGHAASQTGRAVLEALEHGHLHTGAELDHEHQLARSGVPELRLVRIDLPPPASPGAAHLGEIVPPVPSAGQMHRERTPPPRASGPELLARLCLLRL